MIQSRRTFLGAAACACCGGAAWPLRALARGAASDGVPQDLELGVPNMRRISKTVWTAPLVEGVWLYTVTGLIDGGIYYPANGLVLERGEGALLIDTCYVPDQAETLLEWSKRTLKRPISQAIATHFHSDRTGGAPGLEHHGIKTFALPLTCDLARKASLHTPRPLADFRDGAHRLADDCELFHPGAGHTRDNVVAWLPKQGVLFGGCFLKSVTSRTLGNVADADLVAWPTSLERVAARYPMPKFVVPGHGAIKGDPLGRTRELLTRTA